MNQIIVLRTLWQYLISRKKGALSQDYVLLLSYDSKGYFRIVDSATHSRPLNSLEQPLYMHNFDSKHPTRPGFEP